MQSATLAAPAIAAAFAASLVEVLEAFTIVLAAATLRGWRPALIGAFTALLLLAGLVALLGPLLRTVPLPILQLVIGILLLLFGLGWLHKAVLRQGLTLPFRDEDAAFRAALAADDARHFATQSWLAGLAAFKAVLLEGLEVVFIVIAVGAGRGLLGAAALGAAIACLLVGIVGAWLRKPLARVPENSLKLGVGVMLSASGVYWTGEGLGIDWPGHDLALLAIAALFLATALGTAAWLRGAPLRVAP